MTYPEREYGLPNIDSKCVSTPKVLMDVKDTPPCPNCGCDTTFLIQVQIETKALRGGKGVGTYVGCPACPWASPMMAMAEPG